jgi:hypothetical protein
MQLSLPFIPFNKEDFTMRQSQFSRPLSIALSPEVFAKIKQITDDRQISMAQFVREVVDTSLRNWQPQEEQTNGN